MLFRSRAVHVHNRLIASATSAAPLRRTIARAIGDRLGAAKGPTCLLLPLRGIEQWDRPGEPLHDPEGLSAFVAEMRSAIQPNTTLIELDVHINDTAFCDAALRVFDEWVARDLIVPGQA